MPQAKKGKNPRVSKGAEKLQCHIHDKVYESEDEDIRKNVCVNDEPLKKHTDGKHYCLFHLPTKEKNVAKFEEIFKARLDLVSKEIEELPEKKSEEAKRKISYDFRYVWFPSRVDFHYYNFKVLANFTSATFSDYAYFGSTIFSGHVYFNSATFSSGGGFNLAVFCSHASFTWVTFSGDVFFKSVKFFNETDFLWTTFSAEANFDSAIFFSHANFTVATFFARTDFKRTTFFDEADFFETKFLETSEVFFSPTNFCEKIDFRYAIFEGYIAFAGEKDKSVFLNKKKVLNLGKKIKEIRKVEKELNENQEASLDLQNVRLEKPERISFHRVRLCPSWFVNVDSRKMVFTDIDWDNLDVRFRNANIKSEIRNLEKRRVSDPSRLFEIACRQLAANAEENSRYEEAAKFRYMAMETKRQEYRWQGRLWSLSWWYKWTSGYGEDWKWAAVVLLSVILFFGLLYWSPLSTFDYGWTRHSMDFWEGIVHSFYVASFQRPEPKAFDTLTKFFILLETIFAPLQAALLALAIRRKFMR